MSSPYRIGVFMPEFKWKRMNLNEIKEETHGIKLIQAEIGADLSQFDGIIHKFTYQMAEGKESDIQYVVEYAKKHPEFVIIEPIDNIKLFVDRLELQKFIQKHPLPSCVSYIEGIELTPGIPIDSVPFKFPLLLKSTEACGTTDSHSIQVIYDVDQLKSVDLTSTRWMAFPFVRHGGVVFKCYALSDHVVMRASRSIRTNNSTKTCFDSQKELPPELSSDEMLTVEPPSEEELRVISRALTESTNVHLIGFDILRREEDGQLCLVDFNYFPCFRGIEDLPGKFATFIKDRLNQRV